MRLNNQELAALRKVMSDLDPQGSCYLFGSRVDDNRRGGDIDVFLDASRQIPLKDALLAEYRLRAECRSKVDLVVKNPHQDEQPIFEIARRGVLL